jgi:Lysylphosphatidylglycerol synthase TM region
VNAARDALGAVSSGFLALDGRWLAVALAFHLANIGCRALAWRTILAAAYPAARVRLADVAAAYAAGVAANAYLPARGGEALKVALVRLRIPGSTVAGVGASGGVVLVFDALVAGALVSTAWALGLVPGVPMPSPLALGVAAAALGALALVVAAVPRVRAGAAQGLTILRTPGVYLRRVVPLQAAAWACRIGVVYAMLAAFGVPASVPVAGLVVVVGGLSTAVPTPGGAGTQQLLVVLALQQVASAASALSFSIGMQVGITLANTLLGLLALSLYFRTLRPSAVRAGLRDAR